jgi:hypothetical protein
MKKMTKMMMAGAGFAALAAAAPATAQYVYANPYGYNAYGNAYGYNSTQVAASRCTSAVQARLNNRGNTGILGSLFGINTRTSGRVLSVTQVNPRRSTVMVRGLATSGRYASNGYGPYGMGAYGALGYSYQPDLSFRCSVDYRGFVRDVDIMRR